MQTLGRISRWRLAMVCACAGMVLALSQRALASDVSDDAIAYAVTAPVNGFQVAAGSTIAVTWKGPGTSNVNLSLVDVNAWATALVIASNTDDDEEELWRIPCELPPGEYLIYVEDVGVTDWAYGTTFEVTACCPSPSSPQNARPEVRIDRSRPMPRTRPAPRP